MTICHNHDSDDWLRNNEGPKRIEIIVFVAGVVETNDGINCQLVGTVDGDMNDDNNNRTNFRRLKQCSQWV